MMAASIPKKNNGLSSMFVSSQNNLEIVKYNNIKEPIRKEIVPNKPKKCIGRLPNLPHKCDGQQIKKAMDKPLISKFCRSIFPCLMLHDLFTNVCKTSPSGYYRNIPVHFTIHFNAFHNIPLICLQATVEVMEFDPTDPPADTII